MKKKLLSILLTLILCVVTTATCTFTTGCSSSEVVTEVNNVLSAATNVLVVADPNAPWVAELERSVAALKTAETTWQSGGAVADVIDALNAVEAVTAVIPMTAAYSPLIDILVAGIEAVLTALVPTTSASVTANKITRNPHVGRVKLAHSVFHKPSTEFKTAWNAEALKQGLNGAVLR